MLAGLLMTLTTWVVLSFQPMHQSHLSPPKVVAAMRYHGVRFAKGTPSGPVFERDGKTCKLFTQAFERRWRKLCSMGI